MSVLLPMIEAQFEALYEYLEDPEARLNALEQNK